MAAPAQSIDVANLALSLLHQAPITSLTDTNNPASIAANTWYDVSRRELLRNFVWNFAKKRSTAALVLNPATGQPLAPPFDYLNYYQLPVDLLRLLWVGDDWRRYHPILYDINGSLLLLNPTEFTDTVGTPWNSVNILYITDFTNVAQMDALFIKAFVLTLACNLAMPISADQKLVLLLEQKRKQVVAEAQAINHQEKPVIVTDIDRIGRVRELTETLFDLDINPSAWGSVDAS